MTLVDRARSFVRVVLREGDEARRLIEVVRHGLRGLVKSQIPRMAAALAYRTLFSLIPVLVVGAVVLGAFLSDEELRAEMDRLIEYVGLDTIVLEEIDAEGAAEGTVGLGAGGETGDESAGEGDEDETGVEKIAEALLDEDGDEGQPGGAAEPDGMALTFEQSKRLDEWITGLVGRVSGLPFKAIGFVGVVVLLYGAISMLVELERAFNQIYGVTSGRSWLKRLTTYWTTLTLGVVFLLATFSVGDLVANWVASIGRDADGEGGYVSRGLIQFGVNTLINAFVLLVAYSTVPNARVHLRPAMGGALIAGLAWEVGKFAFTQYVQRAVTGLEQLYGVLALLPLFMFWVYITWIVVLFGLQVSYALQTFGSREDGDATVGGPVDPLAVVRVARLAAVRFEAGEVLDEDVVVSETGMTGAQAGLFLKELVAAGVLREVEEGDGPVRFVLGRPASGVMVTDLVAVARGLRAGGGRGGVAVADTAVDEALEGVSLAGLMERDEAGVRG